MRTAGSTQVSTTTTDSSGLYHFINLAPGTYNLKFTPPNGETFTAQTQGSDTAADSDANASGVTSTFVLTSGQSDQTRDAGILPINLSLTKTVDNTTPELGKNVTFTITLANASGSSSATAIAVNDLLPAGLTFVSANPAQGTYTASSGMWHVGSLASGASTTLTVVATVTAATVQTNTAQVAAADQLDVNSTPNNSVSTEDDQASIALTPRAAPRLSKAFFLGR